MRKTGDATTACMVENVNSTCGRLCGNKVLNFKNVAIHFHTQALNCFLKAGANHFSMSVAIFPFYSPGNYQESI